MSERTIWQRFASGERPAVLTENEVRAVQIPGSPMPATVEWHRDGVDLYYGYRAGEYHLMLYSHGALGPCSEGQDQGRQNA